MERYDNKSKIYLKIGFHFKAIFLDIFIKKEN